MVNKCFKISGRIADRRQIPPARILNDLFESADALNTLRISFGQSDKIGYDGSWIFGIWNPVCCGQGYNHIGDWSLGLKQSSINAWWEGFNGGWKCGDYGVEGNELFFNTPAREIGQYYLNCNGWEYWVDEDYHITDEGFFAPIHPVDITRIYVGGSLGASYETFGDAGTILMAKIHWFDLNSLRRLPANTVITRAILHLTINSLPTWHNNHLYFLIKNGEKIEETYTPESGNTGSLDLILIAYSEELYKSEIPADPHPCPYKVKKYLFPVRGVKGITVNQIGDYWIDITDLLNYLIGQRDSKYKFGLMPAFLLDDFVSTQTDKRHLLALRNQTITINTCKSWFDIECNYYFEVDYEWQYIEADLNAFTMNACYFTFELDEAIYQRNLMYNAPPSNID